MELILLNIGLERGLITREMHGDDRRRSVLTLSEAGYSIYDEIVPLALGRERKLLATLDAERGYGAIEDGALYFARREIVMVVQPDLPDGQYLGMRRQFPQPVERHQRIRDLAERGLDRLLIGRDGGIALLLGQLRDRQSKS